MVKYIEKIIESVTGFSFDFVDKSGFALADEYIEELELSTIGKSHIPLFRGSFEQAKREAAEQTALLCLFMIPSINHPLRSEFEKSIFCSEKLCEFWNEKPLIALAMDATTPEGYSLVQKMNIGSLPTISLLVQTTRLADSINVGSRSPDKWAVILRAEGLFTDSWLKDRLEMTLNLLTVNEIFKNERQRNLSSDQQIREEQDIAYLKSLEADAAKKRERERREALEAEALNLKLEKERSLEEKKNNRIAIVSEIESRIPKVTDFQSGTKISVQLLNGNRYLREFSKDSVCSSIYDWAYCVHFEDLSFDNFDFERNQFRLRLPLAAMDETMETRDCTNSLPDSESITLLCAGIRGPTKLIVELSSADDGVNC